MTLAPLAMTIAFMGSRSGAVRGPLDLGLQSYDCACVSGCWSPRDICAERSDASRGKGTRKLADPVTVLPFVAEATQAQATSIPACPEGDRSWSCSLSRRWRGRVLSDWDADDQSR